MSYNDFDMVKTRNGNICFDLDKERIVDEKRNIFVLFSGGLDSAVLVHRIASMLKINESVKYVNLVIAKSDLHHSAFQSYTQRAIDSLLIEFNTQGLKIKASYVETMVYSDYRLVNRDRSSLTTMRYPYQLTLANTLFTQSIENTDMYMGIVEGDGLPAALNVFEDYFYSGMKLLGYDSNKIYFPLLRTRKAELIEYARAFGFYGMTVSCETPTNELKDCGHCCSCITREASEMIWKKLYGRKEENDGPLDKILGKGTDVPINDTTVSNDNADISIDVADTEKTISDTTMTEQSKKNLDSIEKAKTYPDFRYDEEIKSIVSPSSVMNRYTDKEYISLMLKIMGNCAQEAVKIIKDNIVFKDHCIDEEATVKNLKTIYEPGGEIDG